MFKRLRDDYQTLERQFLAPYAVKSSETQGRRYPEKEHDLRTPFQRDRDRIIHSTAFRRLQYKTQVFVNHEGDHYRTRLTHTIETCQISRSIARVLGLNEDLVEAIALAHDLGHGPFGHAGEWALQELMKDHGGFEHNVQGLRILENLEDSYPDFPGLNLCYETLEGVKKHPEHFYEDRSVRFHSLEADLVDLADEIAYNSHDLDDGLRSGLITEAQVENLELWRHSLDYIRGKYPKIAPHQRIRLTIRLTINFLANDVVEHTLREIERLSVRSLQDLQAVKRPVVCFSELVRKQQAELKRFLHKNLYQHVHVLQMTEKGQRFLKALFEIYLRKPGLLPADVCKRAESEGIQRSICDYIAGMTDRYATEEYKRLFEPNGV